ncbi:MAG: MinD/ParA family protein [Proteobacteria bacterium]|nr:MinD/ParA family protein [Pseudomonadota bacterium]
MQNQKQHQGITRVISFTSGKGGVGKTSSVINIGISLARQGRSVLLLDADLGLANIDVMLGLTPNATLHDVLEGRRSLQEILLPGPEGIMIIPSASGVESICTLSAAQRLHLLEAVEEIASDFDYLLIDTQAGIGSEVMYFNSAAGEVVCVINGEPTSLTDAYAMIKLLSRNYGERTISILVNNVVDEREAKQAYSRLSRAVERFLQVELRYLGFVQADLAVREAVQVQTAVSQLFPSSQAGLGYARLARTLDDRFLERRVKGGLQFFFKQLLEVSEYGRH